MKKIQTLLMMFSLFFLFSFSSAATFTFEEGKYQVFAKDYKTDFSSYSSDLENISNLEPNFISPALPDLVIPDEELEEMPYITFAYYQLHPTMTYNFIISDRPLYVSSNSSSDTVYCLNGGYQLVSDSEGTIKRTYFTNGSSEWIKGSKGTSTNNSFIQGSPFPIFYANYNVLQSKSQTLVYSPDFYSAEDKIVMENPLTDEEIKSILEIFLDSVRNSDLPEHYGRYVLTYNKVTGRYTGFVYPNYIDLGIKYGDFNENEKFYYVQDSVGNYYHFSIYEKDTSAEWFTDYLIYEFRSNSTNTFFNFNTTYKLYDKLWGEEIPFISSTLDEPIIYTSHKIYSMFFQETIHSTGNNIFYLDEETSIIKQEFKDDVGIDIDNSINESTNTNTNVNLLSFIKVLFDFIFSLVSFLVRFFAFIVTFIIVPASTNILPEGFVQGIEWIHTFAFGEVLLWDIFSISFGVLLSIYIVKLIRSH